MARKVWNRQTLSDGKEYMVHADNKYPPKLISGNGRFLHIGPDQKDPIQYLLKHAPFMSVDDLFGCKDRAAFHDLLETIYHEELGIDRAVFQANNVKDPPILYNLYPKWYQDRDAWWLYSQDEYAFETLHCNLHVTAPVSKNGKFDDKHSMTYILQHQLEFLDYDQKDSFKILDLCSGMGLTTLVLAKRFPNSTVYYNELNQGTRRVFKRLLDISGLTNVIMLDKEEIDVDVDVLCAFEAVEHIQHDTIPKTGQPFPWFDKFLNKLKDDGHLIYYTMWNAEFNPKTGHKVLGHFREYDFDGEIIGHDPNKNGGKVTWDKDFRKCLNKRGLYNMSGRTGLGYKGHVFFFNWGPRLFMKTQKK